VRQRVTMVSGVLTVGRLVIASTAVLAHNNRERVPVLEVGTVTRVPQRAERAGLVLVVVKNVLVGLVSFNNLYLKCNKHRTFCLYVCLRKLDAQKEIMQYMQPDIQRRYVGCG
jgi:hypothetical protein